VESSILYSFKSVQCVTSFMHAFGAEVAARAIYSLEKAIASLSSVNSGTHEDAFESKSTVLNESWRECGSIEAMAAHSQTPPTLAQVQLLSRRLAACLLPMCALAASSACQMWHVSAAGCASGPDGLRHGTATACGHPFWSLQEAASRNLPRDRSNLS
jgi:hypothetical protein